MPHRVPMLIGAACLLVYTVRGADGPSVSISRGPRAPAHHADFRIDSDLVLIPVSVTDSANHAITGLGPDAFRVFDDKAEQRVIQFAREDAPLSVGIVFDMSGSMKDKLAKSREAVDEFLRGANPEDEFFLVEFNNRVRLTVPFTTDPARIRERMWHAEPSGRTALLDAVSLALDSMKHAHHTRRALLVLSDGGDNDSRYTRLEMSRRVREADLWLYSIGIPDRHTVTLPEESGAGWELLETLAEESGGRHYSVQSPAELPSMAARIGLELRNQYVLGYRPNELRRDGKYHRVQVKVVEGRHLMVSWRPGYYGTTE